jgi:hypothetical protein
MNPQIPTLGPDHKPAVAYNAQPLDVLKARLPAALKDVINCEHVAVGLAIPPSKMAEHVFDYDGMRIIISRDKDGIGPVILHISYSLHESGIPAIKATNPTDMGDVLRILDQRVDVFLLELFGNEPPPVLEKFLTKNLITHLMCPDIH